jgi:hypothetical protein
MSEQQVLDNKTLTAKVLELERRVEVLEKAVVK